MRKSLKLDKEQYMTSTLVVGNGLGMALAPNHFPLQMGLEAAWNNYSNEEKALISLNTNIMPTTENQLEDNHKLMTACHKLLEFPELDLLSQNGMGYPDLYRDFIYKTALHFFNFGGSLPEEFINSLVNLIQTGCHIVTLNYDKLLYSALVERHILRGYNGALVDGITDAGYHYENMLRTYNQFNWYLHIHGSPIFYTANSEIYKCSYYAVPSSAHQADEKYEHIVLAQTQLKPEIISNSPILGSYFDFFSKALLESSCIYIFGYSGEDIHINNELKNWALERSKSLDSLEINIIQWSGAHQNEEYWKSKIIPNMPAANEQKIIISYFSLDNILEYRFPDG